MDTKQIVKNFIVQGAKECIEQEKKQIFDSKVMGETDMLYFY